MGFIKGGKGKMYLELGWMGKAESSQMGSDVWGGGGGKRVDRRTANHDPSHDEMHLYRQIMT